MRTYYHVAGPGWNQGQALYSFDRLEQMGYTVEWKWEGEPVDTDVVCMFEDRDEALSMQAEYGGTLIRISIPHDDVRITRVREGYPAIFSHIPAEWLTVES